MNSMFFVESYTTFSWKRPQTVNIHYYGLQIAVSTLEITVLLRTESNSTHISNSKKLLSVQKAHCSDQ